jgi:hypothetical protein
MPKFRRPPSHPHSSTTTTSINTGVRGMERGYQYYPAPMFAASREMVLMVAVFRASRTGKIWLAHSFELRRSAPPSWVTAAFRRHGARSAASGHLQRRGGKLDGSIVLQKSSSHPSSASAKACPAAKPNHSHRTPHTTAKPIRIDRVQHNRDTRNHITQPPGAKRRST